MFILVVNRKGTVIEVFIPLNYEVYQIELRA